jgi:hypothetical protein
MALLYIVPEVTTVPLPTLDRTKASVAIFVELSPVV